MTIQPEISNISAAYAGLIIFGIGYNTLVSWAVKQGYLEGFMSLAVAAGNLVIIAAMALLIGWQGALIVLGGFAAAGAPMIVGSIMRYMTTRKQTQDALRRLE